MRLTLPGGCVSITEPGKGPEAPGSASGHEELHMEYRTYTDVKPRGSAGWSAYPCASTVPATPVFAAVQAMEHLSITRTDGNVRPMGPSGGSTG